MDLQPKYIKEGPLHEHSSGTEKVWSHCLGRTRTRAYQTHVIHLLNSFRHEAALQTPYLESDVRQKVEFFGVHPEILQHAGVVHEVRKMSRDEEVAEAHHLLGSVDDHGLVDAGPPFLSSFLQHRRSIPRNLRISFVLYQQPIHSSKSGGTGRVGTPRTGKPSKCFH